MTEQELRDLVIDWDSSEPNDDPAQASKYGELLRQLGWFGGTEWACYLPANHSNWNPRYLSRLAQWIGNADNTADRKLLLEYARHITFFSHDDICALLRTAFCSPITRWVIDHERLRLNDPSFHTRLADELHRHTWFCPVTDSLDINEFYHLNNLSGISHRPAFATMTMLDLPLSSEAGAPESRLVANLKAFIAHPDPRKKAPPLKRLVLLEDFVGSGSQSVAAVEWAVCQLDLPVLFVPLVICPPGAEVYDRLVKRSAGKLTVRPLISLRPGDLLGSCRKSEKGIPHAESVEAFARREFERVAGGPHTDPNKPPYTYFGWKETGCSVVTYSNTPNNSLPLIHHRPENGGWHPLFPRSARV